MEQTDDFTSDAFFNDGSLQQLDASIDASVGIDALNAVSLPSNPLVVEQILVLCRGGSLSRLSWSRHGHLASISEDATKVILQCLLFDPIKHAWTLSPQTEESLGTSQLLCLAWSPVASDLAVVDTSGRLAILRPQVQGVAANRLTEVYSEASDNAVALEQIIGLHWLGQDRPDRPKLAIQYASKSSDTGTWEHRQSKATPLPPLFQRAIITITRGGSLTLTCERPDSTFGKTSIPIPVSSEFILTHSACAPTVEGKLLVVIHAHDGTISAYLVSIDFSTLKESSTSVPTLSLEPAASSLSILSTTLLDGQPYDPDSHRLTHLGIIPTTEVDKAPKVPPTVYGVYSSINKALTSTDPGFLTSSIIRRWTLSQTLQTLHPKFNDLPARAGNTAAPSTMTSIQRLPDKEDQIILSASYIDLIQSVSVTTHDGRTDFLNTEDLSPSSYAASTSEVSSLAQAGFTFPLIPPSASTVLSPSQCVIASPNTDSKIEVTAMDYPTLPNTNMDPATNPQLDTAVAAVTLSFARACWSGANIDDLLALIMHTFPPSLSTPLITSVYRTNFKDNEFINERVQGSGLEKAVQKPVLTKIFSFHYAVSFLAVKDTPFGTRPKTPLAGQWVWTTTNLRFVAQLLYVCIREVQNVDANPGLDYVEIVCGNIRWTLDLLRWMVSQILEVGDRETNPDFFDPLPDGEAGDGSQGLTSLLLNCHWSRQFFVAIIRALKALVKMPEPRTPTQMKIIKEIGTGLQGKGMGFPVVDSLLNVRWSAMGEVDEAGGGPLMEREVAKRQFEMMTTGVVVGGYRGTVKRVLDKLFNAPGGLREKGQGVFDRLKLFTDRVDFGWLLLDAEWEDHGKGKRRGRRMIYDVHKKKIVTKGVKETGKSAHGESMIKRCVRCGRYSEDVNGMGKDFSRHIAGLMLRCVCDGAWIVEPWGRYV